MKRKIISIVLLLILISSTVNAVTLELDLKLDKKKIKTGEELNLIVDWKEKMQAADFELNYDAQKFDFVDADIEEDFYTVNNGKIKVVWISLNDTDKTQITFKFKATQNGKTEFEIKTNGGFATGNLVEPDNYKCEKENVQIGMLFGIWKVLIIVVVIIVLILFIIKKIKNNKGGKKK